jgi:ATP-binding cassette, subfamily B, bacterial
VSRPAPKVGFKSVLHLGRTVRLVWSIAPGWTLANVVLAVVQGLLPVATLQMLRLITNAVVKGAGAADKSAAFGHVAVLIVIAGLLGAAAALARSATALVSAAQGQVVTDHISDIIHAKSIEVDLEYYESSRYYDVLHRAQQEAPYRPTQIVNDLVSIGQSLISLAAVLALLFSLSWVVGLVIVVAALPSAYFRMRYSNKLYEWERRRTGEDRRSWYLHWLLTDGSRAKEIRLFELGATFRRWYSDLRAILRREKLAIVTKRSLADFVSGLAAVLAIFGTFAYIAWRTVMGTLSIGAMIMYYGAIQLGLSSLQQVLGGFASLYEDNLFLTYFHEFQTLERTVSDPPDPRPVPRPLATGIAFENVSFSYPDTGRRAIDDVSFAVRPGEVAALVGANGSGKTTLVKLLCRLYDPDQGRITIDGCDLRGFELVDLRRSLSVIFQDYAQYQLTARQNIWMGNVRLDPEDSAIEAAARDSGAAAAIAGLRAGFDTVLGKVFEDGEELSIGEWQKVALARAFVRGAEILVLDEPTSALDPLAEWRVFEHIREMARGKAVLLISHRFSTVRLADRIHIVEDGSIVESGTHAELLALNGLYARMYDVQARSYR